MQSTASSMPDHYHISFVEILHLYVHATLHAKVNFLQQTLKTTL